MSLLARLRSNPLALAGVAGVVLILVISILAVAVIPAGSGSPTPAPGTSPTPLPSIAPTPTTCTPGGPAPSALPSAAPTEGPTTAPSGEVVSEVTDSLVLAKLPTTVARTAEPGAFSVDVSGKAGQQFSLSVRTPDGKVTKAGPTDAKVSLSLTLVQGGAVSITVTSKPAGLTKVAMSVTYGKLGPAPSGEPSPSITPEPTPTPTPRLADAGIGDHCAYISVYVHTDGEGSPLDTKAQVVAKRIVLDSDPTAPSIQVAALALPDGGFSLPASSGASWRILVADANGTFQRVFDREAARQTQGGQFCPEVAIRIVPGQVQRFIFDVYRTSSLISCPGPVALIDTDQTITPDAPPPSPVVYLNPVRLGVDTAQALRYRPDVVSYLRSLEETNTSISPLAALFFIVGVGGMVLFGSFAIWLLFGAQDLEATSEKPISTRRRRRWRR